MQKLNKVFIATSLDGFIADKNGGIEWLETIPEINQIDSGYEAFTKQIDALVMGRATFEKVCSFGKWPYKKPVLVVSNSIKTIPSELKNKVQIVNGSVSAILSTAHQQGYNNLYIDGGKLIQSFLKEDLIDELIITTIPVLLGEGIRLFSDLPRPIQFECFEVKHFLGKIPQCHYRRIKKL